MDAFVLQQYDDWLADHPWPDCGSSSGSADVCGPHLRDASTPAKQRFQILTGQAQCFHAMHNGGNRVWSCDRVMLGLIGFDFLVGLQFDPDFRTLYAIAGGEVPQILVALDPTTGQATPIARTDLPTRIDALTFTADGRLVVAGRDRNLYQLDPVTGASTLLGPTGVEFISGMTLRVVR